MGLEGQRAFGLQTLSPAAPVPYGSTHWGSSHGALAGILGDAETAEDTGWGRGPGVPLGPCLS